MFPGRFFEALLSGVSTGTDTVMAARTVTLQWQDCIRLSKDKTLDGNRFWIGVFARYCFID